MRQWSVCWQEFRSDDFFFQFPDVAADVPLDLAIYTQISCLESTIEKESLSEHSTVNQVEQNISSEVLTRANINGNGNGSNGGVVTRETVTEEFLSRWQL